MQIRALKFELHNQEWLQAIQSGAAEEEEGERSEQLFMGGQFEDGYDEAGYNNAGLFVAGQRYEWLRGFGRVDPGGGGGDSCAQQS